MKEGIILSIGIRTPWLNSDFIVYSDIYTFPLNLLFAITQNPIMNLILKVKI